MQKFNAYFSKVDNLVEVIAVEDVKQMLRELGLEQFYLNGSETSPPIRIPYNTVKEAIEEIYQEDE